MKREKISNLFFYARRSRTAENIAAVAEIVEENPGLSFPRRSLELGIPQTSLHRILHEDLGRRPRVLADWVVETHENYPEFHRTIILSDEANFHLGGFVNKQNCRIWARKTQESLLKSLAILNV